MQALPVRAGVQSDQFGHPGKHFAQPAKRLGLELVDPRRALLESVPAFDPATIARVRRDFLEVGAALNGG